MRRRERIGRMAMALCGAGAVALMLAVFYQPIVDPCDRCALAIPWSVEWWACILIGCW